MAHTSQGTLSSTKANSSSDHLSFQLDYINPTLCNAQVIIDKQVVDRMFHEAATNQRQHVRAYGFSKGEVPINYIKQNFKDHIISHLKEFFFKYCVINYLYEQIRKNHIVVAGDPRLSHISLDTEANAHYNFEISIFPNLTINDWKYLPFKAPRRKNYKDLDRQVEHFIKDEKNQEQEDLPLDIGDWVHFQICVANAENTLIIKEIPQSFWFKLGDEIETESQLYYAFIGKKKGDAFFTNNNGLQDFFSDQVNTNYNFFIQIIDTLSHRCFSLEYFKRHFRIKTNKDMHKKLIEVFSYRNDMSQRRDMVEESLSLLLSKHQFDPPKSFVLRQQQLLLELVKHNPDYNVYRVQNDFEIRIRQLAEKQSREMLFIDNLAYHENITVDDNDTKCYLNFFNRQRMKEFIYFDMPSFKVQGQEVPIPSEELKRTCMREKTINYIIYQLTK